MSAHVSHSVSHSCQQSKYIMTITCDVIHRSVTARHVPSMAGKSPAGPRAWLVDAELIPGQARRRRTTYLNVTERKQQAKTEPR
jgi:hypothetical protein